MKSAVSWQTIGRVFACLLEQTTLTTRFSKGDAAQGWADNMLQGAPFPLCQGSGVHQQKRWQGQMQTSGRASLWHYLLHPWCHMHRDACW